MYSSVDTALVVDVLPDAEHQSYTVMLWGAGVVAALGALAVIPIKRVR